MADQVRKAQPKEFHRKFLEQGLRPDNREIGNFRPTVVNISSRKGSCLLTAESSALARQGETTVICGLKAEIAEPKTDKPNEGFIVPNVDLTPLCSSIFRSGIPGEKAQVLNQAVHNVIRHSQCIALEDLCIEPGKKVWVLYADLSCLNYDGNVFDVMVLALTAALTSIVLPGVKIEEDTGKVCMDFKQEHKVPLRCSPISTTLAIFDESVLLVDPTGQEEELMNGVITVVTEGTEICSINKPGGTALTDEKMRQCVKRAFQRHQEACALINTALGGSPSHSTSRQSVDR